MFFKTFRSLLQVAANVQLLSLLVTWTWSLMWTTIQCIVTLTITMLLDTGSESSVDHLMKPIFSSISSLCRASILSTNFPHKTWHSMTFLAQHDLPGTAKPSWYIIAFLIHHDLSSTAWPSWYIMRPSWYTMTFLVQITDKWGMLALVSVFWCFFSGFFQFLFILFYRILFFTCCVCLVIELLTSCVRVDVPFTSRRWQHLHTPLSSTIGKDDIDFRIKYYNCFTTCD